MTNTELETFISLFDTAISSTTPAVKKALRNLLLVVSIDSSTTTTRPLQDTLDRYDRRLEKMTYDIATLTIGLSKIRDSTAGSASSYVNYPTGLYGVGTNAYPSGSSATVGINAHIIS